MSKKGLIMVILLALGAGFLFFRDQNKPRNVSILPKVTNITSVTGAESTPPLSVVADNLRVPWALAFLPDGGILVTERAGRVLQVKDGATKEIAQIKEVHQTGESGLHGIALHPDFEENRYVYVYYTYSGDNNTLNRVVRYRFGGTTFTDPEVVVDEIPGAVFHDGGRIKFGPDKFLYIATGDALEPSRSQDKNSLAGKILRVTDDGKAAPGNPFGNRTYSYGHRNPQGITWDEKGQLWNSEHGQSATDELNRVDPGKNYGWPTIRGDEKQAGMEQAVIHSGSDTWAPGGVAYLNGSIFFAGLRGQALFQVNRNNPTQVKTHFKGEFGRIRDVVVGPDSMLYITTSNHDGRGTPDKDDDRIIRVNPDSL